MAGTRDEEIEAEARAILRETIQRSGWYPSVTKAERAQLIEKDVDRHWHLMKDAAVNRLDASPGRSHSNFG